MQIALIQMPVTADKQENLRVARRCLEEAAAQKVDLAVLPEMFCCPYENACFRTYGEPEGGPAQELCQGCRRAGASMWWEALFRNWMSTGCTTPAMSSALTAHSWPSTARSTSLTSTSPGAILPGVRHAFPGKCHHHI